MKSAAVFLKNEFKNLRSDQQQVVLGYLWPWYGGAALSEVDPSSTKQVKGESNEAYFDRRDKERKEAGEQFIEGTHPQQKLLMDKIIEHFESNIEGDDYKIVETFKDYLLHYYRGTRDLFHLVKKSPSFRGDSTEEDYDQSVESLREQMVVFFPEFFEDGPDFDLEVMAQDARAELLERNREGLKHNRGPEGRN